MERLDLPVEFVGGLRVSDEDDGRGREDGARRQGQQGHRAAPQPPRAAGGRAVRRRRAAVPRRAPGRARAARTSASSGAIERVDDGRDPPRRAGLHPGHRVGRRRPRGQLVQHQRRRGGRRGRARAGRLQGDVPDRRARLAARPGRPRQRDLARPARTRSRRRCRRSTAACGRSSRPASTRSTAASAHAHIVDGRVPHSLLLELFTDAGIGTKVEAGGMSLAELQAIEARARRPVLRALPGRVRARRGHAPVGRRRQRVPRLPRRHLGAERRPLPPARSSRRCASRSGRLMHVDNLFYTEPAMRLAAAARDELARRQGVLLQLRRGGERGGDQARAQGAAGRRDRRRARRLPRPHVRRAVARRRRSPSRRRSRRSCRASSSVAPEPAALEAAVDDGTAAVLLEPIQGETGVHVAAPTSCCAPRAPPATASARRSSSTRSRPAWGGPARCGRTSRRASCPTR